MSCRRPDLWEAPLPGAVARPRILPRLIPDLGIWRIDQLLSVACSGASDLKGDHSNSLLYLQFSVYYVQCLCIIHRNIHNTPHEHTPSNHIHTDCEEVTKATPHKKHWTQLRVSGMGICGGYAVCCLIVSVVTTSGGVRGISPPVAVSLSLSLSLCLSLSVCLSHSRRHTHTRVQKRILRFLSGALCWQATGNRPVPGSTVMPFPRSFRQYSENTRFEATQLAKKSNLIITDSQNLEIVL